MRIYQSLFILASSTIFLTSNVSAQGSVTQTTASAMQPSKAEMRAENRHTAAVVRRTLERTKGLDVSDIRVRARAGSVSLSGTVPDATQIATAGSAAGAVPGVKSVDNHLTPRISRGH